ncbi:MAG: hypothetical protein WCA30_17600 [Dermatophilaceae bacterium]
MTGSAHGWASTVGGAGPSRDDGSGALMVTGGRGGFVVALEDLGRVVNLLVRCAETVSGAAFAVRRLELSSWSALLSAVDTAVLLGRIEWCRAGAVGTLRDLAGELDSLVRRTTLVVAGYRLAEQEAAALVALARSATVAVTLGAQVAGNRVGLLLDGAAEAVEPVPVPVDSRVVVHDLASVLTSQSLLSGIPVVRVIEVAQSDGSGAWIVQIPGTQEWSPRAGPLLHDLTSDVRVMSLQRSALGDAALAALAHAQAGSGRPDVRAEPVMLTGHSLGGMVAMAIAADDRLRAEVNLTHVVTAGSPVGHVPVPPEVQVLALEHTGDVVPLADLTPNPDLPHWTTVRRDVPDARMILPGSGPLEHSALTYRETARLAARAAANGAHPSLVHWVASASPFLVGESAGAGRTREGPRPQRVRDYRVGRRPEGAG